MVTSATEIPTKNASKTIRRKAGFWLYLKVDACNRQVKTKFNYYPPRCESTILALRNVGLELQFRNPGRQGMAFDLNVNGTQHTIDAEPQTPLLWVIRDHLGLTGTKF